MAKNFISEQFSAMCRDLTNLSSLIKRLPPRYAKVAAIPPTRKGMENEPVNKIVVTGVSLDIENYCTLRLFFDLPNLAGLSR
ncbi:DNA replication terminus site-binding protein, partial [Enterobacter cloacae complex sp. 2024EL-00786]|uniref:DNA replication terminus site-binding protein n=1 Tax=Enterobacter cloacae complex sp. 2024EL-00786 TaxID=3389985 RepID=UPI0039A4691C